MELYAKYIDAEKILIDRGFVLVSGTPLKGVLFHSENGPAIIIRTNKGYEIGDYSISPNSIFDFIRNNPGNRKKTVSMIETYVERKSKALFNPSPEVKERNV